MLAALRNAIRAHLGLDRMEASMARISDALNRLVSQQREATAAQLVSFTNLQTAVDKLRQSAANGELSEDDQKAVDQLSAGFDDMIRDAQAADDGVEEPMGGENPTEEVPAGGETPVDDGAPVTDPVDPGVARR